MLLYPPLKFAKRGVMKELNKIIELKLQAICSEYKENQLGKLEKVIALMSFVGDFKNILASTEILLKQKEKIASYSALKETIQISPILGEFFSLAILNLLQAPKENDTLEPGASINLVEKDLFEEIENVFEKIKIFSEVLSDPLLKSFAEGQLSMIVVPGNKSREDISRYFNSLSLVVKEFKLLKELGSGPSVAIQKLINLFKVALKATAFTSFKEVDQVLFLTQKINALCRRVDLEFQNFMTPFLNHAEKINPALVCKFFNFIMLPNLERLFKEFEKFPEFGVALPVNNAASEEGKRASSDSVNESKDKKDEANARKHRMNLEASAGAKKAKLTHSVDPVESTLPIMPPLSFARSAATVAGLESLTFSSSSSSVLSTVAVLRDDSSTTSPVAPQMFFLSSSVPAAASSSSSSSSSTLSVPQENSAGAPALRKERKERVKTMEKSLFDCGIPVNQASRDYVKMFDCVVSMIEDGPLPNVNGKLIVESQRQEFSYLKNIFNSLSPIEKMWFLNAFINPPKKFLNEFSVSLTDCINVLRYFHNVGMDLNKAIVIKDRDKGLSDISSAYPIEHWYPLLGALTLKNEEHCKEVLQVMLACDVDPRMSFKWGKEFQTIYQHSQGKIRYDLHNTNGATIPDKIRKLFHKYQTDFIAKARIAVEAVFPASSSSLTASCSSRLFSSSASGTAASSLSSHNLEVGNRL